ncbi:MAG: hypothetical protein KBS83_09065, partial [Lachnospiraceae bacterium]|nr:hypothetical protein [Candidatus Equihabitans merdae]
MKHYRQVIALLLATAMVAASIGGCASVTEAAEKESTPITESSGSLEQAAVSLLTSHGNEKGKNETVYIIADADGNIKKTEVSCWLKNPSENAQIKDHTSLSDIENVKGNESYKKDANGDLIWDAQGNDIVYQGIADASNLPISTSISYELDGKTVKADQLAGANGHLKVTFSYKNNIYKNVVIDGENTKLYQPFLVISGMLMDMDKASNVTVSNGKTIEFSDKNIVVGTAMPGLSDSLGLDSLKDVDGNPLDLGIPEDVVIEADIHDFSLLTTVTVYDNNALSSLDLDKVT